MIGLIIIAVDCDVIVIVMVVIVDVVVVIVICTGKISISPKQLAHFSLMYCTHYTKKPPRKIHT